MKSSNAPQLFVSRALTRQLRLHTGLAWLGARARAHALPGIALLIGLIQGILYLTIVPPWQHYDEPTHFEYAWLIANRGRLPQVGDVDYPMRREVAASMLTHDFYKNLPKPHLLTDSGEIWIGITELVHPPAYYIWASLPVYLARYLPIEMQLYAARLSSLALLLATLAVAIACTRDLTPPGHPLRWLVPLALALIPPFIDLMTAVNNDVGAIAVMSLFLWSAIRLIRYGFTVWRLLALTTIAALAVVTKNTAAVAVLLAPLAVVLALWQQRGWRWRWLALGSLGLILVAVPTLFGWGDAARWYRWHAATTQTAATRLLTDDAPLGQAVFRLTATHERRALLTPILANHVQQIRGQPVTVGAWVWASRPVTVTQPTLAFSARGTGNFPATSLPLALTTTPLFVSQVITPSHDTPSIAFYFEIPPLDQATGADVYLDGALVVAGAHESASPPQFTTPDGSRGSWGGQSFTNLIRNGSAEAAWPRLQPWVEESLISYGRRSPAQVLASLFDIDRIAPFMLTTVAGRLFFSFFGTFGWSGVNLSSAWQWLFLALVTGALAGTVRWLWHQHRSTTLPGLYPALVLLFLSGSLVWGNALLRALPLLDGYPYIPVARYGFPAILPALLVLVGGWWALLPRRWQWLGTAALLSALLIINGASIWTLWSFYHQ